MRNDLIAQFLDARAGARGQTPVPLISASYSVTIESGLAVVETVRLFRNLEADPIEAVLTFPVPVHATLFDLCACIQGRRLEAVARPRSAARGTYENAIDRGKAAVLHEEVMPGLHMVSVANIAPGEDIRITATWAMPLSVTAVGARLRIPQSVGHLYGQTPLQEADDLVTGGRVFDVTLTVHAAGSVKVAGAALLDGRATLTSAAPIDIMTDLWRPAPITGVAASGKAVALTLTPLDPGDRPLDVAVLVDRSGSMNEPVSSRPAITGFAAAQRGLRDLARALRPGDRVDLWSFSDQPIHHGGVGGAQVKPAESRDRLRKLTRALPQPQGGTEIGRALAAVLAQSSARDILLITDGLSHALDHGAPDLAAHPGRRISAVLVGSSSFEGQVGQLAARTGGDIFTATAHSLTQALAAATAALRREATPPSPVTRMPDRIECVSNNVLMVAEWLSPPAVQRRPVIGRAAAAVSASLVVRAGGRGLACRIACDEGLVCSLTSLVLVDEAGPDQLGLPAFRKVALSTSPPDQVVMARVAGPDDLEPPEMLRRVMHDRPIGPDPVRSHPRMSLFGWLRRGWTGTDASAALGPTGAAPGSGQTLADAARGIDWGSRPQDLVLGKLDTRAASLPSLVLRLIASEPVVEFARRHGVPAEVAALGLLARSIAGENRRADRVWRKIAAQVGPRAAQAFDDLEGRVLDWLQGVLAGA
jgi:hypothetical protein